MAVGAIYLFLLDSFTTHTTLSNLQLEQGEPKSETSQRTFLRRQQTQALGALFFATPPKASTKLGPLESFVRLGMTGPDCGGDGVLSDSRS